MSRFLFVHYDATRHCVGGSVADWGRLMTRERQGLTLCECQRDVSLGTHVRFSD